MFINHNRYKVFSKFKNIFSLGLSTNNLNLSSQEKIALQIIYGEESYEVLEYLK